jgi:hypothetical protein
MRYQGLAGLETCPMDMRKYACGKFFLRDRTRDGLRYDLRRLRVGRVCLDDHRASCRQGRSRVAARRRIGKRKIAGAKDHYGPDRHLPFTQIGISLIRYGGIYPYFQPVACLAGIRITGQLKHGPGPFVAQTRLRQVGLPHRRMYQSSPAASISLAICPHQVGPLLQGRLAVHHERLPGFVHHAIYFCYRCVLKFHIICLSYRIIKLQA